MKNLKKTIWFVNQYSSTPETGMGGRHYYMARELGLLGHEIYLISGSFGHKFRNKKNQSALITFSSEDHFCHCKLRTLSYKSSRSIRRVANWFIFSFLLGYAVEKRLPRPDVIVYSSPQLIGFLGARRVARKLGVQLIFEVRDIWPLTLIEAGGYSKYHPLIMFMQWVEDRAYKESRRVFSNLPNAVDHMVRRGMCPNKFSWIPNGFSHRELTNPESLSPATLSSIPIGKFIVGYTGAFGATNALDILLGAAERLKKYDEMAFVLVGDGPQKPKLELCVKSRGLMNVFFIDPIPKMQIQSMLSYFDLCYHGAKDLRIYDFGVGANKLPEYFVSGTPVVQSYSGACDPVAAARAGLTVPAEDSEALASAILELSNLTQEERTAMGDRGRSFAYEEYEHGKLAQRFLEALDAP